MGSIQALALCGGEHTGLVPKFLCRSGLGTLMSSLGATGVFLEAARAEQARHFPFILCVYLGAAWRFTDGGHGESVESHSPSQNFGSSAKEGGP